MVYYGMLDLALRLVNALLFELLGINGVVQAQGDRVWAWAVWCRIRARAATGVPRGLGALYGQRHLERAGWVEPCISVRQVMVCVYRYWVSGVV
jgi:hypothetical protein